MGKVKDMKNIYLLLLKEKKYYQEKILKSLLPLILTAFAKNQLAKVLDYNRNDSVLHLN